jgi:hypothetical protein
VEALDVIALSGVLTTIDPFEAWAEGRAASEMPSARAEASRERWRSLSSISTRDACVFELAVIACLDRMHSDARKLAGQLVSHGDEKSRFPIALPDVLVASIYATFNAAYVFPQFACAQEFLSVGAWLGNLVKGRAALMPLFVADYLTEELNPKRDGDETEGGRCTNILRFHAEQAVGIERLYELAQRVKATGRPMLVKPRPMPAFGFMPYAWNVSLFQQIDQRLGSDRLAA